MGKGGSKQEQNLSLQEKYIRKLQKERQRHLEMKIDTRQVTVEFHNVRKHDSALETLSETADLSA